MSRRILFLCLMCSVCLTLMFNKTNALAKEKVEIPADIQELCEQYGEEYNICPELIEAMCWTESRCKPTADNGTCKGLTQINPKYFKTSMNELGITDLFDADQNIHLCAYTLSKYFEENEDLYYVLMCWNSGTAKAKKLYQQELFTKYAVNVSNLSAELEREHGK